MPRSPREYLRLPLVLLISLASLIAAAASAEAAGRTVLLLLLNETSGKVAVDSSGLGHNGTFGAGVAVGQAGPSLKFTTGHITVKNYKSLSPGTSAFTFSADFAWDPSAPPPTAVVDYDLMRKGLSTTAGGDYKMELLPAPTCILKDAAGKQVIVSSPRSVLDGAFHTIVCQRTAGAVSITVDGATTSKAATLGSIANTSVLTVGAKSDGGDQTHGYLRNVAVVVG